jgi:hypothetical protein
MRGKEVGGYCILILAEGWRGEVVRKGEVVILYYSTCVFVSIFFVCGYVIVWLVDMTWLGLINNGLVLCAKYYTNSYL